MRMVELSLRGQQVVAPAGSQKAETHLCTARLIPEGLNTNSRLHARDIAT